MRYLTVVLFMALSFFATSVAMAQSDSFLELAGPVLQAFTSGNYAYAAALALVLLVALVRRFGGAQWPFLASRKMAPFLVLVASFGSAMAVTLSAGEAPTLIMFWAATKIAVLAAGGYSLLKPLLDGLRKRAPLWMLPLFTVLDGVFKAKSKAAVKAGEKAVKKNPSKGLPIKFKDVE